MRDRNPANCDCARLQGAGINRVLFLTHVGEAGGAELKMIDLCGTVRRCAEVMLFQHGSLEDLLRAHEIKVSVRPMPSATGKVRREGGILAILWAIPGALAMVRDVARKGRQFDAVVCFSQKSFVIASLAKPFMRRPILWFMNDILSTSHFSRALIGFLVLLSRYSADHIAVNSKASFQAWSDAGGRRRGVSIIYPGIQDEQIATQLQNAQRIASYREKYSPDSKPLIGMFGRISRWKGQDVFLKALARVRDVNAIIVGGALFSEQEYEREIRKLAADLGIEERVTFVGHVSEVMSLMAACDIVAHCSTAPEPFGLVIAEAMFAGTPVIASDAGGAREIVVEGETGQLTPLQDDAALAGAILRYLANPKWAREMAHTATSRAREKFSGTAMAHGFLEALAAL